MMEIPATPSLTEVTMRQPDGVAGNAAPKRFAQKASKPSPATTPPGALQVPAE